jgi:tetratricopeptide (TPR) repeat protein
MLLSSAKESQRQQLYQLLEKAEYCYCLKDVRGQYEFGKALSLFSYPFDVVGDYYQSLYLHKTGQKHVAYEKLGKVRRELKGSYADKATLMLSGIMATDHDLDKSLKLRLDLTKSESLTVVVESAIGIAAILGSQGEHDKAIEELERVLPLLPKLGNVPLPFDVLNSYATELAEVGKIELASEIITPVILSPYSAFYPNWPETEKEIREKSSRKSMVTFNRSNVIPFPVREVEEPQEVEETETEETAPRYPYQSYLLKDFELEDKVEVWMYESVQPDDLGTLLIMLGESRDENERDLILEKAINYTFMHSEESKNAKVQWRDKIISKMKPPEK